MTLVSPFIVFIVIRVLQDTVYYVDTILYTFTRGSCREIPVYGGYGCRRPRLLYVIIYEYCVLCYNFVEKKEKTRQ